ncbi:hypothetical protein [Actinomadura luteofluorescens]|uniref:hypothetical protein n=1 Tax=Actinomadura luteofluorescens TaxID=46163 RepID=UPI003D8CCA05
MPESSVYIAEAIWFQNNPVDGRERIAVCASLDDAVTALRDHGIYGGDLVATKVDPGSLGTDTAQAWAVHERGKEPDDEGHLWITAEHVATGGAVLRPADLAEILDYVAGRGDVRVVREETLDRAFAALKATLPGGEAR